MICPRQSDRSVSAEKGSWLAAIPPAAVFLAANMGIASKRLFWQDEAGTVLVAPVPGLASMWRAMAAGADLLPAACQATVRASEGPFGQSEFAARLPR
jgi:hypothetical protein